MSVPPSAVGLAYKVAKDALAEGRYGQAAGREVMREALEAAAPRIAKAERERILAVAYDIDKSFCQQLALST